MTVEGTESRQHIGGLYFWATVPVPVTLSGGRGGGGGVGLRPESTPTQCGAGGFNHPSTEAIHLLSR